MLATRRSYDDFQRLPHQAMNPVAHDHHHLLSIPYGDPYPKHRDSPDLDTKSNVTHRKRVPVACERCRKRKIKCSGDQGDGTGCENCRTAGFDGCQFLRVHSSLMECPPSRWHGQHYHPYASRSRHSRPVQQPYIPQSTLSYPAWPNGVDYSAMQPTTAAIPCFQNGYDSTFPMYDRDPSNSYTSQPPSYMLPDPDHGTRSNMSFDHSMSKPLQSSIWHEQTQATSLPHQSSQISLYPLTPVGTPQPFSLFPSQPGQHPLSNERSLSGGRIPTPSLTTTIPSLPSHRDTAPLSAMSHQSSHTWNSETTSHISNTSSRTSCSGNQDISAIQRLTTCEDQAAVYPYPTEPTSPQVNITASALPIAREVSEQDHLQGSTIATSLGPFESVVTSTGPISNRKSRDSLRTSSPVSSLFGYNTTSTRLTRRSQNLIPHRLMTSELSSSWNHSPTSSSHTGSLSSHPHLESDSFHEHRMGSTSSLGFGTRVTELNE